MQIAKDTVASIQYTLTNDSGQVLDQSQEGEPLTYLHGAVGIIPGLEKELEGKRAGDQFNTTILPEEAYGDHQPEMIQQAPRSAFPPDAEIAVGMQFNAETPTGPATVMITEISNDMVTIDSNHPLAGMTLHFEGKVEAVRAATAEELDHGHVH